MGTALGTLHILARGFPLIRASRKAPHVPSTCPPMALVKQFLDVVGNPIPYLMFAVCCSGVSGADRSLCQGVQPLL